MEGRFPYKKLPKYPHLKPADIKIWERFIEAYPGYFDSVDYDIKIGTPREYSGHPGDVIKEDLEYLSRKRIDVVGYTGEDISIVEVKPLAGVSAIGQVECYTALYRPFVVERINIVSVIITDAEVPDIKDLCFKRGIFYFIV